MKNLASKFSDEARRRARLTHAEVEAEGGNSVDFISKTPAPKKTLKGNVSAPEPTADGMDMDVALSKFTPVNLFLFLSSHRTDILIGNSRTLRSRAQLPQTAPKATADD